MGDSIIGSPSMSNLSASLNIRQQNVTAANAVNCAVHLAESSTGSSLREIDTVEWRGGTVGRGKFKLYTITVPSYISQGRRFQASLDNRVMTVILPLDIMPGQRILVKAPSPSVSVQKAQAFTVLAPTKKVHLLQLLVFSDDNTESKCV